MPPLRRVEGVLLAAGESRRMGYPKPLLLADGISFLARSAASMLEVTSRLIIVVGAHADRVAAAAPRDPRVVIAANPDFRRGQLSSLKAGLAQVSPHADAVLVHLADHPLVRLATFKALIEEYERGSRAIVIAGYQGHRGHPVIFDRSLFGELMGAPEDQGVRVVVNADPSRVAYLESGDPGTVLDLDTPADVTQAGLVMPSR